MRSKAKRQPAELNAAFGYLGSPSENNTSLSVP
jgi:hypothetical protein